MSLREQIEAVVLIRDVQTGEERRYVDDWDAEIEFLWSEGNCACDCNRALFFARAANEEEPDIRCGSSRYHVRIEVAGKTVYEDDPA